MKSTVIAFLTSVGSNSTMHRKVNELMPTKLMNTTKPKLTTGIQSTMVKLKSRKVRYMYVPIADKPMEHPAIEIISSAFRPNVSTSEVELNVPATCSATNMIDDMYGSIRVLAFWNIMTLYATNMPVPVH